MVKIRSVKFNYIMNNLLSVSAIIFPLITFPYVSRILQPVGTGKISFAASVIVYFSMFAQLGIPTYGIRACAKVRDDKAKLSKTVQEIMIINLVTCVIAYFAFFFALLIVPRLQEDKNLFVITSLTIVFNAIGVEWLYKGLEQYAYITIRSIVFKVIALIAMFLLVKEKNDYVVYGAILVLATVGSNIFNFINLPRIIHLKPVGSYNFRQHLKPIAVFFAMSVATTVYTQLDIIMLGFMKSDADVGYYNAAVKIKSLLINFVASLGTVLLPRVSYYVENGMQDAFDNITKKAINFMLVIACPLVIYFTIFAKEGIIFLSGNAYLESVAPMQILMPTILIVGLTNVMGIQMLVPLGKEKVVLYSAIAGAVANLIINFSLIPYFESSGAAIGTLVAEMVVFVVQYIALKDKLHSVFIQFSYWKIIVSIMISVVSTLWIKAINLPCIWVLIISACLYFGVYLTFLNVFKEQLVINLERPILKKIFKYKN